MGCLILWSGVGAQDVIQPWVRIGSEAEAKAFADAADNMPRSATPEETAIGEALLLALKLLAEAPAGATRQVGGGRGR